MAEPYYQDDEVTVHHGDCLDVMASLPDASVDAVVTDPPYGLEFMGREWDSFGDVVKDPADVGGFQDGNGGNPFSRSRIRYGREGAAMVNFQTWCEQWATECLRVLKPGGYLLAFGGTRTWHRLAAAIEDAGFEIRDSIAWLYGSGFPKSLDVSKAIDKAAGAEREQIAVVKGARNGNGQNIDYGAFGSAEDGTYMLTAPATDAAKRWQGFGTALKPAFEPIVVARKPIRGTVAANVVEHGCGALNIDACRVGTTKDVPASPSRTGQWFGAGHESGHNPNIGRWPANVVLDGGMADELDKQSGTRKSSGIYQGDGIRTSTGRGATNFPQSDKKNRPNTMFDDSGGASRFFPVFKHDNESEQTCTTRTDVSTNNATDADAAPKSTTAKTPTAGDSTTSADAILTPADFPTFRYTAKAPTAERPTANGISHATVKPLELMRWLVRLVTPPHGLVLDPFAGSGTTAEACIHEHMRCITIEREADYLPVIVARLSKPMAIGFDFGEGA